MLEQGSTIAVLGGTGALGSGLAQRWAKAGFNIILGSRDPKRAEAVVGQINDALGSSKVRVASYEAAAAEAALSVLAVPFALQSEVLTQVRSVLAGKVLIDCTAPLVPPKVGTVQLPPLGSSARTAQTMLGGEVIVVSAFQNISAGLLKHEDETIDCDVLVCSDNPDALSLGVQLAEAAGLRGIDAGPLDNSAAAEALTSLLITINRRYKASHAGIRITGLPGAPPV